MNQDSPPATSKINIRKSTEKIENRVLVKTIIACVNNATRLLSDAQMLEFENPPATKFYLSIIAQEELSKAFILYLVKENVIDWDEYILKATKNHCAKHLVGIVLDFLCPDDERFTKQINDIINGTISLSIPNEVADAIDILRHEKIGRWKSKQWVWDKEPEYDKHALFISDGRKDKIKQNSLYVELGKNGNWTAPQGLDTCVRIDGSLT
jgi:AbiV family abortive infection protein